jgi:hypothetical protein
LDTITIIMLWKLCLQAQQRRVIVEISPEATIAELVALAADRFQVVKDGDGTAMTMTLRTAGIPPRAAIIVGSTTTTEDDRPPQSLASAGIANQDRIIVEWQNPRLEPTVDPRIAATAGATTTTATTTRRSKRAAAIQATESMPALIAAQDAAAEASTRPNRKQKTTNPSAANNKNNTNNNNKRPKLVNQHFAALASSPARRLKDGQEVVAVATTRSSPNKNKKKHKKTSLSTLIDDEKKMSMEEGLVQHAQKRGAWRDAVNSAYEQNRAVARLAAVTDQIQYQIIQNDEESKTMVVTYEKGIQGRGVFTDTVDYISAEALRAAISISADQEEGLRPSNLALLSPRVFWAIRYHFPAATVETSLQHIAPLRDWSFLRRRPIQLSQKALENVRQEQEQNGGGDNNNNDHTNNNNNNWEAAAAAIAAVEDAMVNAYHGSSQSQQRPPPRTTGPSLSLAGTEQQSWVIVTTTETDEDELAECVTSGGGGDGGDDNKEIDHDINDNDFDPNITTITVAKEEEETQRVVQLLLRQHIHNWRELANWDATELWTALSSSSSTSSSLLTTMPYSVETVQQWIDHAQLQTIDEIMVEVCEGDVDAVEALRETARIETPRDLTLWSSIVSALHETLLLQQQSPPQSYEIVQLARWCGRAQAALDQLPWLQDYITPVVGLVDDDAAVVGDD